MKIVNDAKLPYRVIGKIIDDTMNYGYQDTIFYGKIDNFKIEYQNKKYNVQIRYLKRYTEWRFYE
jgi:hypothetical protein